MRIIKPIMKTSIFFFSILICCRMNGEAPDISKYEMYRNVETIPPMSNMNFQHNATGWTLGKGFSWKAGSGMNGSGGLQVSLTNPNILSRTTRELPAQAGKSYKISYYVRIITPVKSQAGKKLDTVRAGYLEFNKGKGRENYLGWIEPTKKIKNDPDAGWQLVEFEFPMPPNAKTALLTLWLNGWNTTGEAVFDEVDFRSAAPRSTAYFVRPLMSTINADGSKLKLKVFSESANEMKLFENNNAVLVLKIGEFSKQLDGRLHKGTMEFAVDKLPKGIGTADLFFVDTERKLKFAHFKLDFQVVEPHAPPPGACVFDAFGRAWVDGELFMPLGVYLNTGWLKETGRDFKEEMKIIGSSPFNCILDYLSHTWGMTMQNGQRVWADANAISKLDIIAENGLKTLISVASYDLPGSDQLLRKEQTRKIVNAYKRHSAILGWYICDELPLSMLDQIASRKEWINRIDPSHPTFLVNHVGLNTPYYGAVTDVIGCDPYPLRKKQDAISLTPILRDTRLAQETGLPQWNVPQIFSWGVFEDGGKNYDNYIEPTERQIRSMFLLMANYGSRGFIAYSRSALYRTAEARRNYEANWANACAAAQTIREQKDFIMSKAGPQAIEIKTRTGFIDAKKYLSDKGETRVFLVSMNAEKHKAFITLPGKPLKSLFGNTISHGNGKYEFTADGVDSDILIQEK